MSFTKLSGDGRGGFNVFENWTTGDESFSKILPYLVLLPITIFYFLILPVIMWIIVPLEDDKSNRDNNFVAIIASIIFLLDYMTGGFLWCIFTHTDNLVALEFFGALHVGFLIINLVLRFVMKNGIPLPFLVFYGAIIVVSVFGYGILHSVGNTIKADTPSFYMENYHNEQMLELEAEKLR
jgi:hypothetical protein